MEIQCRGFREVMTAFGKSLRDGDSIVPADDPGCPEGPRVGWMVNHADGTGTYILVPFRWIYSDDVAFKEILRSKIGRLAWESEIPRLVAEERAEKARRIERNSAPGGRWDEIV